MKNNLKEKQLDILKKFRNICEKNGIKLFLAYGTALGAYRHKGFIPWDDDIDVFILQEDRNKVIEILNNNPSSKLFYQTPLTDKNYRFAVDRVRLSDTTLIENDTKSEDINHGVFIDVYPLFNCSKNIFKYYIQIISRYIYRLFIYKKIPKRKNFLIKAVCRILLLTSEKKKINYIKNNYEYVNSLGDKSFYSTFYGDEVKHIYPSKWFKEPNIIIFEDTNFYVCNEIVKYLTIDYGKNFNEIPPVEKRKTNHNYHFIDLEKGYENYKGIKYMEKSE